MALLSPQEVPHCPNLKRRACDDRQCAEAYQDRWRYRESAENNEDNAEQGYDTGQDQSPLEHVGPGMEVA